MMEGFKQVYDNFDYGELLIKYFFLTNSFYVLLLITAWFSIQRQYRIKPLLDILRKRFPSFAPSISILAPAYNEQLTIVESIQSFLMLDYPNYEVIVINDGSKDKTLARLIEFFKMEPEFVPYEARLSLTPIRGTYRSVIHPNLLVIDKENGGKADALNVGLGHTQFDIVCAVDSDSILENDALLKVAVPFFEDPVHTVASGGTIRIVNGSRVRYGRVEQITLPPKFFVLMQIVEYTRAFLCGRIGWNVFNANLIVSGAFGLFSRQAVIDVGGYMTGSIGEDMELVMRLHRHFLERKKKYSIVFIPDPVCWTEGPADYASLRKQRDRWQRGLADTLIRNRSLFLNPKYGFIGLFAFPYFFLVELLAPIIELSAVFYIVYVLLFRPNDVADFYMLFLVGVLYGMAVSMAAIVMESVYFPKYTRWSQFLLLFTVCFLESFGYRQITSSWRLQALIKYFRGDKSWGYLQRAGFGTRRSKLTS